MVIPAVKFSIYSKFHTSLKNSKRRAANDSNQVYSLFALRELSSDSGDTGFALALFVGDCRNSRPKRVDFSFRDAARRN